MIGFTNLTAHPSFRTKIETGYIAEGGESQEHIKIVESVCWLREAMIGTHDS
jgi:hypothetical protein